MVLETQYPVFPESLNDWINYLAKANVRGLLILCKKDITSATIINSLQRNLEKPILIEDSLSNQAITHHLGTEHSFVIFDTEKCFDANTFCGINGIIKGGGVLALILSESEFTGHFQSFLFDSKSSAVFEKSESLNDHQNKEKILLSRFLNLSTKSPTTAVWHNEKFITNRCITSTLSSLTKKEVLSPSKCDYSEQKKVVKEILKVSNGHSRRPLVITADRGRGKTAALGLAAAKLVSEKPIEIVVTAPQISALDSFFQQIVNQLELKNAPYKRTNSRAGRLKGITIENCGSVEFIPVDRLLNTEQHCHTLMIDEAAAIPVSQLKKLNTRFNRVIYSTTVHGYEGSGKGFDIRFKKHLITQRPQTRFTNLSQPIRWAKNDFLEKDLFNAFLLNSNLVEIPEDFVLDLNKVQINCIQSSDLVNNESVLNAIFALLINAHYQTRPADLERLFTDENSRLFIIEQQTNILGVCLLNAEGELNEGQCEDLRRRKRQLSGHLLPQSVISRYGLSQFGKLRTARVMRIAIHPKLQSKGLGSLFIQNLAENCKTDYDMLGSSFSATPEVCQFWLKNNFEPIGLGTTKDAASGDFNLEVILPLTDTYTPLLNSLRKRFKDLFNFNLNKIYAELSPEITSDILSAINKDTYARFSPDVIDEIELFCTGKRAISQVGDLLSKYYQANTAAAFKHFSSDERAFITCVMYRYWKEPQIVQEFDLSGKKEIQVKLRALFSRLLEND